MLAAFSNEGSRPMGVAESRMASPTSSFSNMTELGGRNDLDFHKQDASGANIFWSMPESCVALGGRGTRGGSSSRMLGRPFHPQSDCHLDDGHGAPRTDSPRQATTPDKHPYLRSHASQVTLSLIHI